MTVVNRWAVFTIVGALGFIVQTAALVLLTRAGIHYLPAVAMAVEIAVLHNFLCHERWTWRDRPTTGASERLARLASFNLTNGLVSIVGNLVIVSLLVEALGATVVGAGLIGMLLTGLVNFVASDRLVFARPRWLRTRAPVRVPPTILTLMLVTTVATGAQAAELQPQTVDAWNRYVQATEVRITREAAARYRLLADRDAARLMAQLRSGEVLVEKLETRGPDGREIDVAGGLIHHWRGTVFLRGVTLEQLLAETRSPELTARRQPDVLDVKVLERRGETLRLYLKVERRSVITVTYNTEYFVQGVRRSSQTATSRSVATKIAEIADAGTAAEREKPIGQDRGFLWRLNAYWRYEQVDGGVIAEIESITLSRTVPLGLATLVRPIIDREARKSISSTLLAFRDRLTTASTKAGSH